MGRISAPFIIGIVIGAFAVPTYGSFFTLSKENCATLFQMTPEERIAELYTRTLHEYRDRVANDEKYAEALEKVLVSRNYFFLPGEGTEFLRLNDLLTKVGNTVEREKLSDGTALNRSQVEAGIRQKLEDALLGTKKSMSITAESVEKQKRIRLPKIDLNSGGTTSVAYSPDGKRALSYRKTGTIYLWDMETRNQIGSISAFDGDHPTAVYSPDGKRVFGLAPDLSPTEWDAETGTILRQAPPVAKGTWSVALAYRSDGTRVLIGLNDGTVTELDLATGKPIHRFMRDPINPSTGYKRSQLSAKSVAYSPNGKDVLVGYAEEVVEWTKDPIRHYFLGPRPLVLQESGKHMAHSVAYNRAGDRAIIGYSVGDRGRVVIWDLKTRQPLKIADFESFVVSVSYRPDEKRILVGTLTGRKIYELDSESLEVLRTVNDADFIQSLAYHPDGVEILSGGQGGAEVLNLDLLEGEGK